MKKEKIELVQKPYLSGSYCGKDALRLIPKKFFGMLGIVLSLALAPIFAKAA